MTTRQAITELVNEGVFYREQGRGTFVSHRRITQQLIRLTGFTEDISARGQQPSTKVLSARVQPADEETAARLHIATGQEIFALQRLRLADSRPLAVELSQLTFKGCEQLVEEDFEHNSLYRVLESRYGLPLVEADQEIEAGLAVAEVAQLLQIAVGSSVLLDAPRDLHQSHAAAGVREIRLHRQPLHLLHPPQARTTLRLSAPGRPSNGIRPRREGTRMADHEHSASDAGRIEALATEQVNPDDGYRPDESARDRAGDERGGRHVARGRAEAPRLRRDRGDRGAFAHGRTAGLHGRGHIGRPAPRRGGCPPTFGIPPTHLGIVAGGPLRSSQATEDVEEARSRTCGDQATARAARMRWSASRQRSHAVCAGRLGLRTRKAR